MSDVLDQNASDEFIEATKKLELEHIELEKTIAEAKERDYSVVRELIQRQGVIYRAVINNLQKKTEMTTAATPSEERSNNLTTKQS